MVSKTSVNDQRLLYYCPCDFRDSLEEYWWWWWDCLRVAMAVVAVGNTREDNEQDGRRDIRNLDRSRHDLRNRGDGEGSRDDVPGVDKMVVAATVAVVADSPASISMVPLPIPSLEEHEQLAHENGLSPRHFPKLP